jgi:peptide/nickel transport system permease protein
MNQLYADLRTDGYCPGGAYEGKFTREQLKELRVYAFFSFTLWPVVLTVVVIGAVLASVKGLIERSRQPALRALRAYMPFVFLPCYLFKMAVAEGNLKVMLGLVLLSPFLLAVVLSIWPAAIMQDDVASVEPLEAPGTRHLLGTNGEGVGIGRLIIAGARHTYFTSLIAASLVLFFGVWLGKMTLRRGPESIVMGFVEIIEAIPILFLLLVVLAVLSWWEDVWEGNILASALVPLLRIVVVGSVVGIGFLPRMVRLVRERIKTFVSENFVAGTKAHGIDQNRILRFHIIRKNCLGDIVVTLTQIWAAAILIGISLDYLISISPLLGAKIHQSWAGMLLTFEVSNALVNFLPELRFDYWWLYIVPAFFIVSTVIGFYLYGEGLDSLYRQKSSSVGSVPTRLDHALDAVVMKLVR